MVNPDNWFSRDVVHLISIASISHFNISLQIALIAFFAVYKKTKKSCSNICFVCQ